MKIEHGMQKHSSLTRKAGDETIRQLVSVREASFKGG